MRDLEDAFLVGVLDHRHHQPVRRVGGEADVKVLLEHDLLAVERSVELGEFLQRRDARLDQECEHRHLDARLLVFLVELNTEGLELGDVGIVVVRHMRNDDPVAVQIRAADLLDARQVLALDSAELGEVDLRPRQQAGERAASCSGRCFCGGLRLGLHRAGHHALDEGMHVVVRDPAFRSRALHFIERHADFARQLADRRRGMRQRTFGRGGFVGRHRGGRSCGCWCWRRLRSH